MKPKYIKRVESLGSGTIHAVIVRADFSYAISQYFMGFPFESWEHRWLPAHDWADKRIKLLERYEIIN